MQVQEMMFFLEEMQKTAEKIKEFDHDHYAGYTYDEGELITKYIDDSMQEIVTLRKALWKIRDLRKKMEYVDEWQEAKAYSITEKIVDRALGF